MSLKNLYDINQRFIISLDGPAASGKSSIAKLLSKKFHLKYVSSGVLYRYLAFKCQELEIPLDNIEEIIKLSETINFEDTYTNKFLYTEDIGNIASKISTIQTIRTNINQKLKTIIDKNPRVVMEGRDIGSNVAQNANLKVFITANSEIRAERRFKQLKNLGKECMMSELLYSIIERDKRDQEREHNPLQAASDALIIDSSDMTPDMIIEKIQQYII